MPKIAIIDDNTEQSDTVKTNIEICLEELDSDLEVITSIPFRQVSEYFSFIEQNNIVVLILDEMLNDQGHDSIGPVDYKGSQLVEVLRAQLPDFPIFALTLIPTDADLLDKYSQYEDIISRIEFYNEPSKFVPRFRRAAKNYLNERSRELKEFNDIATQVSGGDNSKESLEKLKALQAKLEMPFSGFDDRNQWLKEYDEHINQLNELNNIIKLKLG